MSYYIPTGVGLAKGVSLSQRDKQRFEFPLGDMFTFSV